MHPCDLTRQDADKTWPSHSQDLWKYTRLPNVHVALHFAEFAAEYGSIMSCNVLCGECKHKIWKQWADHAAPKHLMAYLFKHDCVHQTLQLALAGSADVQNEELYACLAWLTENCPQLINSFVSHHEERTADDDVHGSHVHTFGTENHLDQVLQHLNVYMQHHTRLVIYCESFWVKLKQGYQSRDGCDQVVVDNRLVEMYTGVRFLDVNSVSCYYNTGMFLSCGQRYCQVLAIAKYSGHSHIDYFLVV
ncbi:uncharacterized protein ASPGLDRAFT_1440278 [Aspergillus glaucus CBS 516.65]|uniref:Uncharacterized protein n=1 Tax=Aspergillus glaucus CBS 516.65 TaxID=1160497 RepID=A0A1L9VN47_ASPGL|nr:hypothetical protein ASPGLDRAFT_1440278 [Aspergillus glaucus CBS 516.65]OJJ85302.1 hypothetical protein ASPGLDRAFT_1440278 [Aspergillus glaucus CBS 516.65]